MKEQPKLGILQRIFGQKDSCCCLQLEENEDRVLDNKNDVSELDCSAPNQALDESTGHKE